jgi:hypothetical protein
MCSGSGLIGDFRFEDDPGARFIQDSAAVSEVVRRWEGFVVSQRRGTWGNHPLWLVCRPGTWGTRHPAVPRFYN